MGHDTVVLCRCIVCKKAKSEQEFPTESSTCDDCVALTEKFLDIVAADVPPGTLWTEEDGLIFPGADNE